MFLQYFSSASYTICILPANILIYYLEVHSTTELHGCCVPHLQAHWWMLMRELFSILEICCLLYMPIVAVMSPDHMTAIADF